jgi:hypothetical protein
MGLYPNYTVRVGETIRDVIINATGSIIATDPSGNIVDNWDLILDANGFTDWTPDLIPGQQIVIPDTVFIDQNTLTDKITYPANNSVVNGFLNLIYEIWSLLINNWILLTGFWNDGGVWIDTDNWID